MNEWQSVRLYCDATAVSLRPLGREIFGLMHVPHHFKNVFISHFR